MFSALIYILLTQLPNVSTGTLAGVGAQSINALAPILTSVPLTVIHVHIAVTARVT